MSIKNVKFILVRPRNSSNVGAALRAIANFGFRQLAVVNMWKFDEEEASMLAASVSPLLQDIIFYNNLEEAIADTTLAIGTTARKRGKHRRITIEQLKNLIEEHKNEKIAILFGSEKTGLTADELNHCDYYVKIETDEEFPSLNLAQSVAIIAYEISKCFKKEPVIIAPQKLTKEIINKILEYLEKILILSEAPENGTKNTLKTVREVLGRGDVTEKEGKIILWLARHLWWFLENRCK